MLLIQCDAFLTVSHRQWTDTKPKNQQTKTYEKMDSSNLSDNPDFYVHIHNYTILDYGYDEFMSLNSTHKGTNRITYS